MTNDYYRSNENNISIGKRIHKIRSAYGLTQERLSEELGISTNYLGEIERGRRFLSHKVATRLCIYFHLSLDYLYGGKVSGSDESAAASDTGSSPCPPELITLISTCSDQEYALCLILIRNLLNALRSSNLLNQKPDEEPDGDEGEDSDNDKDDPDNV